MDEIEDIQSQLLPPLISLIDEKEIEARDQGLKTLGIFLGRLGEQVLKSKIENIIPQKKQKIEEAAATIQPSEFDKSKRKVVAAQKKESAPKQVAKKPVITKKVEAKQEDVEMSYNQPNTNFDEMPIGNRTKVGDLDELPIGNSNKVGDLDELPVKASGGYNLDNLDLSAMPPPSAKPVVRKPPNIGQKPPAKTPAAVAKPTATTKAPAGKGDQKDEDEGGGLSKEEAIDKVTEFYNPDYVGQFEGTWQEKQKGFQGLQEQIQEVKPDSIIIEATCRFIKSKMKDWKESNMNLMKESIATLKIISESCDRIPKRALFVYAPFLADKIGDVKFAQSIKEVLMTLADFMTAKFVANQVIKYAMTAKAPNNLKESCNILTSLLEEWGAGMMPVKECIDYATLAANNPNVAVRNASMQLYAMLFKHLGEAVRSFLSDIKESTMKLIEEEFKKITPLKKGEFKSSRALKGEAQEELGSAPAQSNLDDALPREDISKLLNSKVLAGFKAKDPKGRKESTEAILAILQGAKMRILPIGLGELMELMKASMKESNKAILRINIQLMGSLAEATGAPIKLYIKKCLVPLLFNMSDKQSLVRDLTIESVNKWAEAVGPEPIITWTCAQVETENPELREESFKWILAHKDGIKGADHTLMVKPLVDCLQDKSSKIRQQAEEVIVEVMTYTGFEPFSKVAKDLKTAVQQAVRSILEKAKAKCGTNVRVEDPREESKQSKPVAKPLIAIPAGPTLKPTLKLKEEAPVRQNDIVKPQNSFAVAASERPQTSRAPANKIQPIEVEDEQLNFNFGNKEKRALADVKSKWMHEEMKPEQIEKVKKDCEQLLGYEFTVKMFSTDFKKHIDVLKQFTDSIVQQPKNIKETIDVISKWTCVKLAESQNTSFSICVFDFYQNLFDYFVQDGYKFSDYEAFLLIPMLCDKSGLNNVILKAKVKKLIKQCFQLYDVKKCISLIFKYGVNAKNLRAVSESLDELGNYIKEQGLENITERDLQTVAKMVDHADKGVRECALTFIGEVYLKLDEQVWRVLGPVNIKVKGLLEGRFKQVKKGGNNGNPMNRSINQVSPLESKRADPLNRSINQSLNKSIVGKEQTTPRRVVNQPVTTKNSCLNSLQMSKTKDNMNLSISSINGAAMTKTIKPSQSICQIQQQKPLKFKSSSQERHSEVQKPTEQQSFIQEFNQQEQKYTMHNKDVMERANTVFQDDDDDLILQLNEIDKAAQIKEQMDPKLREQIDFIMKHVQSLKYGDLSKRVDSLVALNDIIVTIKQYNQAIIKCSNELCSAFTHVMIDVFERSLLDIPLRFAKYFVTIVNRICQSPEVMMAAGEKETFELTEQLLMRLLTQNLDTLGEANKEGEVILKTLNAAMLRLLENCQPTLIYLSLYKLLKKYKNFTTLPKLPGLAIKCLLKLAKIIEKQTSQLEIDRILLVIHEYLLVINHDEKSQNDEMGIRITKTVINELVKIKGESIWESYKLVEKHSKEDNHIGRWISLILSQPQKNLNDTVPSFGVAAQDTQVKKDDREIKQIIDELRSTDLFEGAISKLHNYLQRHPNESLATYTKGLSQHFSSFIKSHLEQYQNSLGKESFFCQQIIVETGATPEPQDYSATERKPSPFAQHKNNSALQSSRLMQPATQNPAQTLFNSSGSTGRAPTIAVPTESSDQRISSYQDKITSMQQRLKNSGSSQNLAIDKMPEQLQPPAQNTFAMHKAIQQQQTRFQPTTNKEQNQASFSQMNSSLSQKWQQISKQKTVQTGEVSNCNVQGQQRSSVTEPDEPPKTTTLTELNQIKQQNADRPTLIGGGATNTDLQLRLAEMKAKLQLINKKKE